MKIRLEGAAKYGYCSRFPAIAPMKPISERSREKEEHKVGAVEEAEVRAYGAESSRRCVER